MKKILSLFAVLLFVVGCGGGSSDDTGSVMESMRPENSPDFEEIEIPSNFTENRLPQHDSDLVPEEMIEMVKDALTIESARTELIRRIREASFCNALDNQTDEEIWNEMVYDFNLDNLDEWGNSLGDAIRNALAHDLPLDRVGIENGNDFYGDTLEEDEAWSILADEVDGLDTSPGQCL